MIKLDEATRREYEIVDDCVSRSGVITLIMNLNLKHLFSFPSGISKKAFEDLLNGVQALPSVTPTQETGKWENKNVSCHYFYGKCSKCGQEFCVDTWYTQNMKYCPNCGARMENNE